jgi:Tol biopolymer transport system component
MLGDQINPRWSPSGAEIFFASSAAGTWDIWSVSLEDSVLRRRVTVGAGAPIFFDVDALSGRLIASLLTPEGGEDLYWLALDTGIVGRLTHSPDQPKTAPRVRPDGMVVAYTGIIDESSAVLMADLQGNTHALLPRMPVPRSRGFSLDLMHDGLRVSGWTPDGAYMIVYWLVDPYPSTSVTEGWLYPFELYAVSRDGQLRVRLTRSRVDDVQADIR